MLILLSMDYTEDQYKQVISILGLHAPKGINGRNSIFVICPFHKEKTASMSISLSKGIFKCFGCGESGTINALSYRLTRKNIRQLLKIDKNQWGDYQKVREEENVKPIIERTEENSFVDIRGIYKPYFYFSEAIQYLRGRGIEDRVATSMNICYTKEMYANGQLFKNRIIIPITDSTGRLVSIEGRSIIPGIKPKVIYPFDTVKTIYEHYKLDKTKPLYLVEGLMDLAVLRSDPRFSNSSVIFGSNISPYQVNILNSFSEVILIPDNDEAGSKSIVNMKLVIPKLSIMKIKDFSIKDVGDIPKTGKTIIDFVDSGGFDTVLSAKFFL